jgi:hypothetical protein
MEIAERSAVARDCGEESWAGGAQRIFKVVNYSE